MIQRVGLLFLTTYQILKIQNDKENINVIIGPCINYKMFEVDKFLKDQFIKKNPYNKKFFTKSKKEDKYLFNMRKLINYQFLENGINNIQNIDKDTYSNKDLFFSHRRTTHSGKKYTGRMINIIGFNN